MARNLAQFQKGISMTEFMVTYGSEANCRTALEVSCRPNGLRCPSCHSEQCSTHNCDRQTFWQCCRHQTSPIAGTIFEASKLPLTMWFLAMFLMTQSKNNISALSLMRHLCVAYNSAWLLKQKLMKSCQAGRDCCVIRKLFKNMSMDVSSNPLNIDCVARDDEQSRNFVTQT